jgi:hypothetical protein
MQLTNQGETETLTRVGVNQDPQFPAAESSQHVGTVVVRMDAEESTDVVNTSSGSQFYEKKVKVTQSPAGGAPSSHSLPQDSQGFKKADEPAKAGGLGPVEVLKNFVDSAYSAHEARFRSQEGWLRACAFTGGIGVAAFILGIITLYAAKII